MCYCSTSLKLNLITTYLTLATFEYNVPFLSFVVLSFVVVSYVPNALWLRRTLFSLSYVNCFRDNSSLNPYSLGDR